MEIQKGIKATLRFPEAGDDAVTLEEPTVTVVRDSDGTTIVNKAAATPVEVAEAVEYYTYTLTGDKIPEVDLLTVTWADEDSTYTQEVEVVGGFVVSLSEIKEKYGGPAEKAPDAWKLEREREIATRDLEDSVWDAFRHRYEKELVTADGTNCMVLSQRNVVKILSVTVDDEALTGEEIEDLTVTSYGFERPTKVRSGAALVVTYVYGRERFHEAKNPVRDLAAYRLVPDPSDQFGRATSSTSEDGVTYRYFNEAIKGNKFPLPIVDAFVKRYAVARIA